MSTLSPELITEVLLWLPVKDLIRFRCVSKWFSTTIDCPFFIKKHLDRSIERNIRFKLILCFEPQIEDPYQTGVDRPTRIFAGDFDGGLREVVEIENPLKSRVYCTVTVHPCDGLLLLSNQGNETALWNPFTRRCKNLPPCPIEISGGFSEWACYGLGFDSADDDFKVVRVSECWRRGNGGGRNQVWVFRVRSNSWKRVQDFPFEGNFFGPQSKAKFAGDALHWLSDREEVMRIFAFDLATELFHEVSMPLYSNPDNSLEDKEPSISRLEVLGGCLCMCFDTRNHSSVSFIRKKDDEVGFTWHQLYNIRQIELSGMNLDVDYVEPLAYSNGGNKILLNKEGTAIVEYDMKQKTLEILRVDGLPGEFKSSVCWESLTLLGDDCEFDVAPKATSKRMLYLWFLPVMILWLVTAVGSVFQCKKV